MSTNKIEEISSSRGGLVVAMNKQLFIAFVNANLIGRANLDMRSSYCYYDSDGDFFFATHNKLEGPAADEFFEQHNIKFWSKGIK